MKPVEFCKARWRRIATLGEEFLRGQSGASMIAFGLSAIPLTLAAGAMLDYTQASSARSKLQQAVDSAAIAAASHMSLSQPERQTLAQNLVLANLDVQSGALNAKVTESEPSGNYVVNATAGVATSIMKLGGVASVQMSASATAAAASVASSGGAKQYAGNGSVAGDPHIGGADGSTGYLNCTSSSDAWYNLLSDSGIQVNVSCVNYSGDNMSVVQSFSILLGTHVVSLYAPQPTFDSNGNATYDPNTAWFGQITIDGVTYAPVIGSHSYLNGVVKTSITDLTNFYASDNMIHINTGTYDIFITYDEYAMGDINITATNAGLCGVPGGFWGGTLAGVDDYNGGDFVVSGPTATSTQFNWSACPASTAATMAHLIE
jgi:Flp pilus assembly protein TadG